MPENKGSKTNKTSDKHCSNRHERNMLHDLHLDRLSFILVHPRGLLGRQQLDEHLQTFRPMSCQRHSRPRQGRLPFKEVREGIEVLATGSSNQGQWNFDIGATDHMSGTRPKSTSHLSSTVTIAGTRKLKITGVGEASLQVPQGLIHMKLVL